MTEPVRPLEALVAAMRAIAADNRTSPEVPCQCERSWHADTYDSWADVIEAALLQAAAPPAPTAERLRILADRVECNERTLGVLCAECHDEGNGCLRAWAANGEWPDNAKHWQQATAVPPERVSEGEENRPQVVEARLDQIRSALQVEWRLKTEQGIHHDHLSDLAFLIAEVEYLQAAARPAVDPPERVS